MSQSSKKWGAVFGAALLLASLVRVPTNNYRVLFIVLFCSAVSICLSFYLWKINKWVSLFNVSALISLHYPAYTMEAFLSYQWILYGVLYYMLLAKTKPDKNIIMDCLCVVSACVVGLLAIQTYIKPEITSWWTLILHGGENGSPIGNMGNQNLASAVVAFCFPAFLRTKPLIIMGSLITALGLIMAKTFGGVLAVSSGVIVWALIRGNQKTVWLLLVGFCGLIYLKYIDQPGSSARLQAWAEGWNITRQHPRFGCGLGNFKTVFPLLDTQWGYLHNDVFQSWFEMGIKTPMLILGFVCSYFWKAESIALIAGVIILVNSLVNFPFHIGTTAMMAITWLGLFNTPIRGGNGNWNCYSHI